MAMTEYQKKERADLKAYIRHLKKERERHLFEIDMLKKNEDEYKEALLALSTGMIRANYLITKAEAAGKIKTVSNTTMTLRNHREKATRGAK